MDKSIIKLLAESFLTALEAYSKTTANEIDDKAVQLVRTILKYLKII